MPTAKCILTGRRIDALVQYDTVELAFCPSMKFGERDVYYFA